MGKCRQEQKKLASGRAIKHIANLLTTCTEVAPHALLFAVAKYGTAREATTIDQPPAESSPCEGDGRAETMFNPGRTVSQWESLSKQLSWTNLNRAR